MHCVCGCAHALSTPGCACFCIVARERAPMVVGTPGPPGWTVNVHSHWREWRGCGHGLGGFTWRGDTAAGAGGGACTGAPVGGARLPRARATAGAGDPHCKLAQLWGRLCRMASRFCLSARISARSFSKLWICSSCCWDSCSSSLSFPCRAPGGLSRSLRRSSAHWVSFRAWAGA